MSESAILRVRLPVPPLEEQRNVRDLLSRAEAARSALLEQAEAAALAAAAKLAEAEDAVVAGLLGVLVDSRGAEGGNE